MKNVLVFEPNFELEDLLNQYGIEYEIVDEDVPLSKLKQTASSLKYQNRTGVESINTDHVDILTEKMKKGRRFNAIAFCERRGKIAFVPAGNHRVRAAIKAGYTHVRNSIRITGSETEKDWKEMVPLLRAAALSDNTNTFSQGPGALKDHVVKQIFKEAGGTAKGIHPPVKICKDVCARYYVKYDKSIRERIAQYLIQFMCRKAKVPARSGQRVCLSLFKMSNMDRFEEVLKACSSYHKSDKDLDEKLSDLQERRLNVDECVKEIKKDSMGFNTKKPAKERMTECQKILVRLIDAKTLLEKWDEDPNATILEAESISDALSDLISFASKMSKLTERKV